MMNDLDEFKDKYKFLEELEKDLDIENDIPQSPPIAVKRERFTPAQKFILSALIFFAILIIGFFILLLTGTMVLPP